MNGTTDAAAWHFDAERRCADGQTHLQWARKVALGVARHCGFRARSQEADDIVSTAWLHLCRKAARFDPAQVPAGGDAEMQLRGWAHISIRAECLREARRLRTGGTYRTPNEELARGVVVEGLPCRRTEAGSEEVDLIDPRGPGEPDLDPREEWSPFTVEG